MARYFKKGVEFAFPDEIFPKTDSIHVPERPDVVAQRLMERESTIDDEPESERLEWARETLLHSEIYGSISRYVTHAATVRLESLAPTNAVACYCVGNWHLFGLFGRHIDTSKAKEFYRSSIKLNGSRAWYRMGASAEEKGDIDRCISRYEAGASLGDAACLYRLAIALMKGHFGFMRDFPRAIELLQVACNSSDEDFPQPLFLLGMVYLGEIDRGTATVDRQKGLDLIEKAAVLHFAPAQIRMAAAYQQNERPYDCSIVMAYLNCASRQERYLVYQKFPPQFAGDAEVQLTKLFLCGSQPDFAPNEEWAYKFALAGVELGNPTAQFALAYFAEVGVFIPRNLELANTLYKLSASNNCSAAKQRLLGFKQGKGSCELARSPTLTRKDHDRVLQRTLSKISQTGRNCSTLSIIQDLGEQLDISASASTGSSSTISNVPKLVPEFGNQTASPAKTPYPTDDKPATTAAVERKSPYPVSPEQKKSTPALAESKPKLAYPISPRSSSGSGHVGATGFIDLHKPQPPTPYPENEHMVHKSSMHIPESPKRGHIKSQSVSPISMQQPCRSSEIITPTTSPRKASCPVRSQSVSPIASPSSRSPSPKRGSPRALFSRIKTKFGSHSPEIQPLHFDQPPVDVSPGKLRKASTLDPSVLSHPVLTPSGSAVHHTNSLQQPRAVSPINTQIGGASSAAIDRVKAQESNTYTPLSSVSEVQRPDRSCSGSPSSTVSSANDSIRQRTPESENQPDVDNMRRMSRTRASPKGRHGYSASMAIPANVKAVPPKTRVASTPLDPVSTKNDSLKTNGALSFDEMGIQMITEEKVGPCLIM